jgi:hypothetical protein
MNRELYIKTIKKECAFLEAEGYTFNQVDTNFFYTKNTEDEGFRIRFSWLEYGDTFVTHGLTAEKRFNIIEQEIQKILGGNLVNYYTIHKSPLMDNDYIPKGLEFQMSGENFRFETNTIKDIELFGEYLRSFYFQDVIKFYSNYKEFIEVAKSYEKLERESISILILNTGNDIFYRELVIKNKSKSTDENNFIQMVVNELEPMKENSTFGKILENFKLLQNNLHSNA